MSLQTQLEASDWLSRTAWSRGFRSGLLNFPATNNPYTTDPSDLWLSFRWLQGFHTAKGDTDGRETL